MVDVGVLGLLEEELRHDNSLVVNGYFAAKARILWYVVEKLPHADRLIVRMLEDEVIRLNNDPTKFREIFRTIGGTGNDA